MSTKALNLDHDEKSAPFDLFEIEIGLEELSFSLCYKGEKIYTKSVNLSKKIEAGDTISVSGFDGRLFPE